MASGAEQIPVAGSFYFPVGIQPGNGRPLCSGAELMHTHCSALICKGEGLLFN